MLFFATEMNIIQHVLDKKSDTWLIMWFVVDTALHEFIGYNCLFVPLYDDRAKIQQAGNPLILIL